MLSAHHHHHPPQPNLHTPIRNSPLPHPQEDEIRFKQEAKTQLVVDFALRAADKGAPPPCLPFSFVPAVEASGRRGSTPAGLQPAGLHLVWPPCAPEARCHASQL